MHLTLLVLPFLIFCIKESSQQQSATTNCSNNEYRERIDIHDMTLDQVTRLVSGFRHLYETRQWERFAQLHWSVQRRVHGCAQFLPFHRVFIHHVETALRQFDSNIVIPYWNWTRMATTPLRDIVISNYFGDNPQNRICNGSSECCVQSGPFSGWEYSIGNQKQCLSRSYSENSSVFYPWGVFTPLMNYTTFEEMAERLEQLHARVHLWVGGTMRTHYSPFDPLFFLHHTFIDKVWYDWQSSNQVAIDNLYGGRNCDASVALLDNLIVNFSQYRVRHLLANEPLCVRYKEVNETASNLSIIIANNISIQSPDPNWLLINGFNTSQIRSFNEFVRNQSENLNKKINEVINNTDNNTLVFVPGVGYVDKTSKATSIYNFCTTCVILFTLTLIYV